jgi:hypothetical protein
MVLFAFIFFQIQEITISEIETLFRNQFANNNIESKTLKKYKDTFFYNDLKQIFSVDKGFNFENEVFKHWWSLRLSLKSINHKKFTKSLNYLNKHYFAKDRCFIIGYYKFLEELVIKRNKDFVDIQRFIKKNSKSLGPQIESSIYLFYIGSLSKKRIRDHNYLSALKKMFILDDKYNMHLRISNSHRLKFWLSQNGLSFFLDIIGQFLLDRIPLKSTRDHRLRHNLVKDLIRNKFDFQKKLTTRLINEVSLHQQFNTLRNRLLLKLYTNRLTKLDTIAIEASTSKFLQTSFIYHKLIKQLIPNNEVVEVEKYYKKYLAYKETNINFDSNLRISVSSFLGTDVSVLDSLYNVFREYKMNDLVKKVNGINYYSDTFIDRSFSDYYSKKTFTNPEFVLNEHLKFTAIHHYYKKNVVPQLRLREDYNKLYMNYSKFYNETENKMSMNTIYRFIDIVQKEWGTIEPFKEKMLEDIEALNYKNVYQYLDDNEQILISFKASVEPFYISLKKNEKPVRVASIELENFLKKSNTNTKFILIDKANVFKNRFSSLHESITGEIPFVRYVNSFYSLFAARRNSDLNSLAFYGMDKAFEYKGTSYSSLPFINDELNKIGAYFTVQSNINKDRVINFNADITHFASHLIRSDEHSLYNKLVVGLDSSSNTQYFSGYDLFKQEINSKLVVLNACKTSDLFFADEVTGQFNLARFFIDGGAESVLVTNRKVFDHISVQFMEEFYKNLSKGLSAMESLQKSSLYIKENVSDDPKIWDSYQLFGSELKQKKSNLIFYIVIAGFVLVLLILLTHRRQKRVA